jgi:hypothetical protein
MTTSTSEFLEIERNWLPKRWVESSGKESVEIEVQPTATDLK